MNSQLNSTTNTTFPSACQGTFTRTGTPCFAIGGFLEESSGRSQRLELTIHKSRHPVDVSEATALNLFNKYNIARPFSTPPTYTKPASLSGFIPLPGGVATRSPVLPKPGHPYSFNQQLLAALHFATHHPSGNENRVGAKRRHEDGQQAGWLGERVHAECRTVERQRRPAGAKAAQPVATETTPEAALPAHTLRVDYQIHVTGGNEVVANIRSRFDLPLALREESLARTDGDFADIFDKIVVAPLLTQVRAHLQGRFDHYAEMKAKQTAPPEAPLPSPHNGAYKSPKPANGTPLDMPELDAKPPLPQTPWQRGLVGAE